jgi:serine/threonine-protein kinase
VTSTGGRLLSGRYELGDLLGYGGMAEVFRGRDVRLGREVAVKVLRADLARDPAFLARFRREAQSAASLSHPSIVSVYDTGEDVDPAGSATVPFIVMEYVEGRTLRDLLRQEGRLLPRRAVEMVAEVCRALDYAHSQGIVHRDIKPGNVMLTRGGQIKVMDFGIARAATASQATVTQTAAVIGTAQYLSPEQARGEHTDGRSDVYSTGCLLYELLTGQPPFTGDSPVAVAYQHVREAPVPPSQLDPEISGDLDAVVLKAMAKNPANRYQTAGEMAGDLERVADGRRVVATPVLAPEARTTVLSPATTATTVLAPMAAAEQRVAAQRRRRIGYAALGFAVIAVIVVASLVTKSLLSSNTKLSLQTPNLVNRTEAEARKILSDDKLVVGHVDQRYDPTHASGIVLGQSPTANFKITQGTAVDLVVSKGTEMITVPADVIGQQERAVRNELTLAGFANTSPAYTVDPTKQAGTVIATNPSPGASVPKGTTIVLTVVSGKTTVPSVVGLDQAAASQKLQDAGLSAGTATEQPTDKATQIGKVISQDPTAGRSVDRGTAVNLVVGVAKPSPTPSPSPEPSPTESPTPVTPTDTASPVPSLSFSPTP